MCILPTLEGWVYRVSYTWASMGYTGHMGHSHIYAYTNNDHSRVHHEDQDH
jgi:hypothetical protein